MKRTARFLAAVCALAAASSAARAEGGALGALRAFGAGAAVAELNTPAVPAAEKAFRGYQSYEYEGVEEESCPGAKEVSGSLVCGGVKDAYKLLGMKIDRKHAVERLPAFVESIDPVSLGLLPDDCTDTIFQYQYELVPPQGGPAHGYAEIIGSANSEASFRKKTTLRYNAEGKLAVIRIEDF